MTSFLRKLVILSALAPLTGCNPVSTGVKIGVKIVGKVVNDAEADKLANELVGRGPSAADQKLGKPDDVWHDMYSSRQWRSYPVKLDLLNQKRTVVEVINGRITEVQLIERYGEDADIPLELLYLAKAKGKSPRECQKALGLGPPLLTVRSEKTNQLLQIYDARLIKELPTPHDCFVRFDEHDKCNKVDMVEVDAVSQGGS